MSGHIVIQPADKGSGICILDRNDYIDEAEIKVNDTLVRKRLSSNLIKSKKYWMKVLNRTISLKSLPI